jgi:hypothetical protein
MNTIDKALGQICLSIEKLQPDEENLAKLLALTIAAHHLLAEDDIESLQASLSVAKADALREIENVINKKIYLSVKDEQLERFVYVKGIVLSKLNYLH